MKKDENHIWSVFNIYLFLVWGFINEKSYFQPWDCFWHISPTKFYGPCVPGWRRHFRGYSIPRVVFSGFPTSFQRRKVYQLLGNYIRLEFSITGLKYAQNKQNCGLVILCIKRKNPSGFFLTKLCLDQIKNPNTSLLWFLFTILHIYEHSRRLTFSEIDFMVNLDGNVRQTVNLSFRDRAKGVLENLVKATLNSRQHTEDLYLIYETSLILLYFQNMSR